MGMLIHRHFLEQEKPVQEHAVESPVAASEAHSQGKADNSTVTEQKPLKTANKPPKRVGRPRASK